MITETIKSIKIIAETTDFLIVYKPAGLIVHGGQGVKEEAMSDILVKKFPELKKVGEDPARPGIVHRLDKEVGGLLIIPRNQTSFLFFKNQFKERLIDKQYKALVYGKVIADQGIINFPITRSKQGDKMAALPLVGNKIYHNNHRRNLGNRQALLSAREALTEFFVEKRFINFTYLNVKIITGRTHQIRVHLNAYGHPIVGDNIYGSNKYHLKNKKLNLPRICLEATHLTFNDLLGQKQTFSHKLPTDFQNILNTIK